MAKRGERKCLVCGKVYMYCPNCGKGDPKESYKYLYDSSECREISHIIGRYTSGKMTKELAKGALNVYDVQEKKFEPDYQKVIDEIFKTDKKKKVAAIDTAEEIVNEDF